MHRVVITGMGAITHYGYGVNNLIAGMFDLMPKKPTMYPIEVGKDKYIELPTYLIDKNIYNPYLDKMSNAMYRNMTNMSVYACMAVDEALDGQDVYSYKPESIGVSIASSLPSMYEYESLVKIIQDNPKMMPTSAIFRTLNNTVSFNIAKYVNAKNRVLSPSAACATSLQSIILGYEAIKLGKAKMMICGGSEEYHTQISRGFYKLGIASKTRCKPFEEDRDGVAVAEGAGVIILENLDYARNRGATIYGEILGTGSTFTQESAFSNTEDIVRCMEEAWNEYPLWDAIIDSYDREIIVDAHATGTPIGDTNELNAINMFAKKYNLTVGLSALKGYLGHSMASCGVIELIATLKMARMKKRIGMVHNIRDLEAINISDGHTLLDDSRIIIKNSFGLGGINTSLLTLIPGK